MTINMIVKVYSGNTTTVLTQYANVTTATINKDGSVSCARAITDPDGQAIFHIKPNANKIEIIRNYDD